MNSLSSLARVIAVTFLRGTLAVGIVLLGGIGLSIAASSVPSSPAPLVATASSSSSVSSSVVRSSAASSSSSIRSSSSSSPRSSSRPAAVPDPASVRIPVLVYHHIRPTKGYPKSTWSYKMSVTPAIFEKQMQWIQDHGYTTVTLDEAAGILAGHTVGPAKPIVITFDDNNRTQFTIAFPALRSHGQTGVFYLITNRLKNPSFILEDEVRTMADAGMEIESHTVTHSTLTALSLKRLDQELQESKATLEALIGKPVRHVAYPSTAQNKSVREHAAAAGYTTGTIMDPRVATPKDDLLKLPRIMMTDDTNLTKVLP